MAFVEFPTLIGSCRLAWSDLGLKQLTLPSDPFRSEQVSAGESRLLHSDSTPPVFVTQAIQRVQGLLRGNPDDLIDLPLDLTNVTDFSRRVYEVLRQIKPGSTMTYGEIAARIGSPKASRAVGGAVGRNPLPIVIPCHRVLPANGQLGGFSAPGGAETKRQLLAIEGVSFPESVESPRFGFDPKVAVDHLRASDRVLRSLIDRVGAFRLRLEPLPSPFQTLFSAIVAQQISNRAAEAILERVRVLFEGKSFFTPEDVASISELDLRVAGLSRAKIAAVKDLSAKAISGDLPSSQQLRCWREERIQKCLTQIRGIGPWTVDMLMIFHLGRGDVLPVTDHGIRTAMAKAYHLPGLPSPREMAILATPWQPYRSVACWYFWRLDEKIV